MKAIAYLLLLVAFVGCSESPRIDESEIPIVDGDTADMGKLYPRIIVDGVNLDYEPKLEWYVDSITRKAMVWEEVYVEGESIPKRLLLPRADYKHSQIWTDACDAELRAKGAGAGELWIGPGDPGFREALSIVSTDTAPSLAQPVESEGLGRLNPDGRGEKFKCGKWVPWDSAIDGPVPSLPPPPTIRSIDP